MWSGREWRAARWSGGEWRGVEAWEVKWKMVDGVKEREVEWEG